MSRHSLAAALSFARGGLARLALLAATLAATGCAQIQLGAPVPSIDNAQKAKASISAPVALGEFSLESGKPAALDTGLNVRSNTVSSPVDGSFAKYLKQTLTVELNAAGLLDPKADRVIHGRLTDSQLDASMSRGNGSLAARFMVLRAGATVYDKEHRVAADWESSFVGAIAIPAAINEYSALYRKLVAALLADTAFREALAR
jgi:hypothetical protein